MPSSTLIIISAFWHWNFKLAPLPLPYLVPPPRLKGVDILGTLTELLKLNPLPTAAHHITYFVLYLVTCWLPVPTSIHRKLQPPIQDPSTYIPFPVVDISSLQLFLLPATTTVPEFSVERSIAQFPVSTHSGSHRPGKANRHQVPSCYITFFHPGPTALDFSQSVSFLFHFDALQQINSIQLPLL